MNMDGTDTLFVIFLVCIVCPILIPVLLIMGVFGLTAYGKKTEHKKFTPEWKVKLDNQLKEMEKNKKGDLK